MSIEKLAEVLKHLPGKHNQQRHAGGKGKSPGGSSSSASEGKKLKYHRTTNNNINVATSDQTSIATIVDRRKYSGRSKPSFKPGMNFKTTKIGDKLGDWQTKTLPQMKDIVAETYDGEYGY